MSCRPSGRADRAALALTAAGAVALTAPALAATDDIDLVSRATGPAGAPVDANAIVSSVAASGAQIAFGTDADNISAEDNDGFINAFVRDALAGTTALVSRAAGPAGAAADNDSALPSSSRHGRYVAFGSPATNLVAGTVPGVSAIYRRDVLGDAPLATPAARRCRCRPRPPRRTPSSPSRRGSC